MKNVILLLGVIIILSACNGRRTTNEFSESRKKMDAISTSVQPRSLKNLVKQFSFHPSDIYGDVFTNKSWH